MAATKGELRREENARNNPAADGAVHPLPIHDMSYKDAASCSLDAAWKKIAFSTVVVPPEEMIPLLSAGNTRQERKGKNKPKPSKKGGIRQTSVKTAPRTTFRQTVNRDTMGDRGVPVTHTSILAEAVSPAVVGGYEAWEVHINPGLSHAFPFLAGISSSYVYYVVNSISIEYVKEVGEQDGVVRMAYAYKSDQPKPVTDSEFSEVAGATKGAPWTNQTIRANAKKVHNMADKLKVRHSHENSLDSYDGVKFWFALNHCPVALKHLGNFYITFTFTFYEARGPATQGSLTSGDQIISCSSVGGDVAPSGTKLFINYNVPEMRNIAGMYSVLEKSSVGTGEQDVTVFSVSRPMKAEVTTTTTVTTTADTAAANFPLFLSTTSKFQYCDAKDAPGTTDFGSLASATQFASASKPSDGGGIIPANGAIHTHHSKSLMHFVPGYKYFLTIANDAASTMEMILYNAVRVANISITFIGSLEHLLTHLSPLEEKNAVALYGPLVHPTDNRGKQERSRRITSKLGHLQFMQQAITAPTPGGLAPLDTKEKQTAATTTTTVAVDDTSKAKVKRNQSIETYKEKVIRLNLLQDELDEIETARVGNELNC